MGFLLHRPLAVGRCRDCVPRETGPRPGLPTRRAGGQVGDARRHRQVQQQVDGSDVPVLDREVRRPAAVQKDSLLTAAHQRRTVSDDVVQFLFTVNCNSLLPFVANLLRCPYCM